MSDVPTTKPSPDPAPPAKGTNPLRLILLLAIFGIALAGLLYDRFVARPAVETAYNQVLSLLEDDERADLSVSPDDVQQMIGKPPEAEEDLGNGKLEIYSWQSGVPFRKHSLYVAYQGREQPMLYSAAKYRRPEQDQLPPQITPAIDMSPEELAKERMPIGAGVGGGSGPPSDQERGKDDDPSEEATQDETQKAKQDEPAKEELKQDEPAKEEPAKEEPAKEEPAKEEPAKEPSKQDAPKKEGADKEGGAERD